MSKVFKNMLRTEVMAVIMCIVVFLGVTTASIGRSSIWHDEGYTATLIEGSYGGIVMRTAKDVHPPLYYLVLKAWSAVVGDSVVTLRWFSASCMLGALIVTWHLLRRLYGWRLAVAGLAAMSMGPFLVRYGQEMRMYGLASLLASLATYVYVLMRSRARVSNRLAITYGVLVAAGMYTQYFFVLVPAVHVFHAAMAYKGTFTQKLQSLLAYKTSVITAAVLFAPWVPKMFAQFVGVQGSFWIGPVGVETLTSTPVAMTYFKKQYEMTGVEGLAAVASLLFVIVLVRQFILKQKDTNSRLLALAILLPPALLFMLSIPPLQPSYQDRYMSFLAPIFYSVLGMAVLLFAHKRMRIAVGISLFVLLFHGQYSNYWDGNNHGWNPRPAFTMNQIIDQIDGNGPVYATSLWTYFDAHITLRDRGFNEVNQVLVDKVPTNWGGNWSALYERPELLTTTIPKNTKVFWLIDESGERKYKGSELNDYEAGQTTQIGYARITKYYHR